MIYNTKQELPKEYATIVLNEVIEIAKDKAMRKDRMIPEVKEINGKFYPWMHIEKYFIRTYDRLIESEGFIDHTTNTAYEEDQSLIMSSNKWKATDIETGLSIASDKSFTDLYNKVGTMTETIMERKQSEDYKTWKEQFEMIKTGKIGRLVKFE